MSGTFWIETVKKSDAVAFVEVSGRIDASSADTLGTHCQSLVAQGHHHIVLDMSAVQFIASSGAGAVVVLSEDARAKNGTVQLLRPSDAVKRVINLLNICHFVALVDDDKEVVANLDARDE